MRCIITVGGLIISLAILILIHASITSENVRNNEAKDALEDSVERAVRTIAAEKEIGDLSADSSSNFYIKPDGSVFEVSDKEYNRFLIVATKESDITYATGICYDGALMKIVKKGSIYELSAEKGGEVLSFTVPLEELSDAELISKMSKINLSCGQTIINADSLLYTNVNIYESGSNSLLLKKNLLTEKENCLLQAIYSEILNNINTDSEISCQVIDIDYNQGRLDLFVKEVFTYPNGRQGVVSCRKAISYVV